MQQYIGIISKNEEGRPLVCSQDDYIRVRIPAIHGPQPTMALTGSKADLSNRILADNLLPWALVSRSFDNKNFSATEFQEGDLVYVTLENDDTTSPIITGYASRFSYTDDKNTADANLLYGGAGAIVSYEKYSKADTLVAIARSQIGTTETATNNIIYNSEFEEQEVSGSQYNWNVVFIWWCFKQISASSEFYGGNKTRKVSDIISFYRKSGRYVQKSQSTFLAGDLAIVNLKDSSGQSSEYLSIVTEDQVDDSISVVIGDYNGKVVGDKAPLTSISGGIKLGNQIVSTTYSGSTKESEVYNLILQLAGYNTAAGVAVITNLWSENRNFDPTLSVKDTDQKMHHGLCMWGPERWAVLTNYCKQNNFDKDSIEGQVNFIVYELGTSYTGVDNYLKNLPNTKEGAGDGAAYWAEHYEVCASKFFEERRQRAENDFWPLYSGYVSGNYTSSPSGYILPLQYENVVASSWWGNYKGHKGVDFITSGAAGNTYGKYIVAAKSGTVESIESAWKGGTSGLASYGNYVLIKHDATFSTRYAHCSKVLVNVGDTVQQGQKIAIVGNSGNVSPEPTEANPKQGAHVHFEVRKNRERVDPASYLPAFSCNDGVTRGNASTSNSNANSNNTVAIKAVFANKQFTSANLVSFSSSSVKKQVYTLLVDTNTNRLNICDENGLVVKTCVCSVGQSLLKTTKEFKIGPYSNKPVRYSWINIDNAFARYASRFSNNLLIHSVKYNSKSESDLQASSYDLLGFTSSGGCITLCTADAKWIYDNCTNGSIIKFVQNLSGIHINEVDLRLDEFKSSEPELRNWDPTDFNVNNPWKNI